MYREGFRTRLESVVRGQATTQSETSLDGNIGVSRSDRVPATSQDIQRENRELLQPTTEESDTTLLHQTGITESSIIIERINQQEADDHGGVREEVNSGDERTETYGRLTEGRINNAEDEDQIWSENPVTDWQHAVNGNEEGGGHLRQNQVVWNEDGPQEAAGNRPEGPSGPPRAHHPSHIRRYNRFHPPDDDNVYSMELRELLSR